MSNVVKLRLVAGLISPKPELEAMRAVVRMAEAFADALASDDTDICEHCAKVAAAENRLRLAVGRLRKAREVRAP